QSSQLIQFGASRSTNCSSGKQSPDSRGRSTAQAAATNPFVPKMSWFPKQHDACRARRLAKSIYLIPSRAHESADATGVACPQQTYRQSGGTGPGAATADAAQLLAILNG